MALAMDSARSRITEKGRSKYILIKVFAEEALRSARELRNITAQEFRGKPAKRSRSAKQQSKIILMPVHWSSQQ